MARGVKRLSSWRPDAAGTCPAPITPGKAHDPNLTSPVRRDLSAELAARGAILAGAARAECGFASISPHGCGEIEAKQCYLRQRSPIRAGSAAKTAVRRGGAAWPTSTACSRHARHLQGVRRPARADRRRSRPLRRGGAGDRRRQRRRQVDAHQPQHRARILDRRPGAGDARRLRRPACRVPRSPPGQAAARQPQRAAMARQSATGSTAVVVPRLRSETAAAACPRRMAASSSQPSCRP